jgi:hypothetical protein
MATWQLAEVCGTLGDRDRALKAYEKVVHQDASFKLAHRRMAKLLEPRAGPADQRGVSIGQDPIG